MSLERAAVLAVDPGTTHSGWALLTKNGHPILTGKDPNEEVLERVYALPSSVPVVVEMVASYGMPVGKEVFETVVWIGRILESRSGDVARLTRKDVVWNLCNSARGNDATVRQALIDRFGGKGTKAEPGIFYGVSGDRWAAIALGVTYLDFRSLDRSTTGKIA